MLIVTGGCLVVLALVVALVVLMALVATYPVMGAALIFDYVALLAWHRRRRHTTATYRASRRLRP